MNQIELVQKIGNEVCEGCGPDEDCGVTPEKCGRIIDAVNILDEHVKVKELIILADAYEDAKENDYCSGTFLEYQGCRPDEIIIAIIGTIRQLTPKEGE